MLYENLAVNEKGNLTFAGADTVELARQYGTPLYVMDEDLVVSRVREYKNAMQSFMPAGSLPEFASKAFCCKQMYRIMEREGIDIDVVSVGEIYTALKADFPLERAFFHGNNKTDEAIAFAIDNGIGQFVVDSLDELWAVDRIAGEKGKNQKILLRVSPGVDSHTHKKIATGVVDCKFGIAIETNQALEAVGTALSLKNITLCGFHCHIGSQIFNATPFDNATDIMLDFMDAVKEKYGFVTEILNLGGGFGVRYNETEPTISYAEQIKNVAEIINKKCSEYGLKTPAIRMEPGRSLVADAGITLYTVGSVKEITGYKNYVSVDGGMTDNPRYTLYEAEHEVIVANKADKEKNYSATLAGCCCESGDILGEDIKMPKPVRGDIIATLTTGAYCYTMASNYNRVARPAVLMIKGDRKYIAVKREGLDDICALDV